MAEGEEQVVRDTYTELYYHLVWSTRRREPLIVPEIQSDLYRYIRAKCREIKVFVHALNGLTDHVHLVCTIPTSVTVAQVMQQVKGASSHFINHRPNSNGGLQWQPGYGALTFARRDLNMVVQYVERQQERHRENKLLATMEQFEPVDPSYQWQNAHAVRESSNYDYLEDCEEADPAQWNIVAPFPEELEE